MTVEVTPAVEGVFSQMHAIGQRVHNGSLDPADVRPRLQRIIEKNHAPYSGLFSSPEEQIRNLRRWNQKYGWGLDVDGFIAGCWVPPEPTDRLTAAVLVPVFGPAKMSFDELWQVIGDEYTRTFFGDRENVGKYVTGIEGEERSPGLHWEIIDFGAHADWRLDDVDSCVNATPEGVMAAVAHHKEWANQLGTSDVPSVFVPGYKVSQHELPARWNLHFYKNPTYPVMELVVTDSVGEHVPSEGFAVPALCNRRQ